MVLHSGLWHDILPHHPEERAITLTHHVEAHHVDAGERAFPGELRTNLLGAQPRTGVLAIESEAQGHQNEARSRGGGAAALLSCCDSKLDHVLGTASTRLMLGLVGSGTR